MGAYRSALGFDCPSSFSPQLVKLVDKARRMYPWLKPRHLIADRGYDSQANHKRVRSSGASRR